MKIRGLMMDPITNMPIVILKEPAEAESSRFGWAFMKQNAIALEIEKVVTPRPMTHDLLKNVLVGLDTSVRKVVVTTIKDDTFYAIIWLERSGRLISIDSRPSDALALALRIDCPIFVEDEVLRSSKSQAAASQDRIETTKNSSAGSRTCLTKISADTRCRSNTGRTRTLHPALVTGQPALVTEQVTQPISHFPKQLCSSRRQLNTSHS